MNFKTDIIYTTDQLDVIKFIYGKKEKETVGIKYNIEKVIILPYIKDRAGIPYQIGVLKEFNPCREGNYSEMTLITGIVDDVDDNNFDTAIRELEEEAGYKVIDEFKWDYLGILTGSKIVDTEYPCYAVDITGMSPISPKPDNSVEKLTDFNLIPMSKAIHSNDCFVLSLLLKLYTLKFGKVFSSEFI